MARNSHSGVADLPRAEFGDAERNAFPSESGRQQSQRQSDGPDENEESADERASRGRESLSARTFPDRKPKALRSSMDLDVIDVASLGSAAATLGGLLG